MKKIIIFSSGLVLIAVLILAAAIKFRINIIEYAVPKIAQFYDVQINAIQIEVLELDNFQIKNLDVVYRQEDSLTKLKAQNLSVDANPSQGFHFELERINIDKLYLEIHAPTQDAKQKNHQSIQEVISNIPIVLGEVNDFDLSYFANDELILHLRASMELLADSFYIEGQTEASNLPITTFNASVSAQNKVSVKISDNNNNLLDWHGNTSLEGEYFFVDMRGPVNFAALHGYVSYFYDELPIAILSDESHVLINANVNINETLDTLLHSLVIDAQLNTDVHVALNENDIEAFRLTADILCRLEALENLSCSVDEKVNMQVLLKNSIDIVDKYFATNEKEYHINIIPDNETIIKVGLGHHPKIELFGDMSLNLTAKNSAHTFSAKIVNKQVDYMDRLAINIAFNIETILKNLVSPISVDHVGIEMAGRLKFDGDSLDVMAQPNTQLSLTNIEDESFAVDQLVASLSQPFHGKYVVEDESIFLRDIHLRLLPMQAITKDIAINSRDSSLVIKQIRQHDEHWSASINNVWSELNILQGDVDIKLFDVNTSARLHKNDVLFDGSLHISEERILLEYNGQHDLIENVGTIKADLNSFPLTKSQIVAQLIDSSGLPMQIKKGNIQLSSDLMWGGHLNEEVLLEANIKLEDIDGDYAQNIFTGLNASLALNGWNDWKLVQPIALTLDEFNIGFPVSNISLDVADVKKPLNAKASIHVEEFSAEALDGSVLAENVEIDFNRAVNEFTIYLFSMSLEKLLALNQTEDLIINGFFNGELPLKLEDDRLSISGGWLKVDDKGGIIKYSRIKDILSGNANIELLAKLLDNFHYKELSTELNMSPDGEALFETKILGSNPHVENGVEVSLNPNIEVNILQMLHNLRLLSRVGEEITNQVIENETLH